jgi:hypothetical protein
VTRLQISGLFQLKIVSLEDTFPEDKEELGESLSHSAKGASKLLVLVRLAMLTSNVDYMTRHAKKNLISKLEPIN